jgi:hypothetical protein
VFLDSERRCGGHGRQEKIATMDARDPAGPQDAGAMSPAPGRCMDADPGHSKCVINRLDAVDEVADHLVVRPWTAVSFRRDEERSPDPGQQARNASRSRQPLRYERKAA